MMHALKSIRPFLNYYPNQMNHRIAATHAFFKLAAFYDITVNPLKIIFASDVLKVSYYTRTLPWQSPQCSAYSVAIGQQSLQHALADKARCAGEENFHERILNCWACEIARGYEAKKILETQRNGGSGGNLVIWQMKRDALGL
jgi:hypothetical protein